MNAEHSAEKGAGWCLCGFVDDQGGTCGNCGLRIMTDVDWEALAEARAVLTAALHATETTGGWWGHPECEEFGRLVAPALLPLLAQVKATARAEALEGADAAVVGLASYNCELRYDGTEDPGTAAWVEGIKDAHEAIRSLKGGAQ